MPDYSKVAETRDVYGELGWIPNFQVKKSKNNDTRHPTYREFFDAPKDYNLEFHTNSNQTNSGLFKNNMDDSISQLKSTYSKSPSLEGSSPFLTARRSFNALERLSFTTLREKTNRSPVSGFILQPDLTNRHKVSPVLKKTLENAPDTIPFLRDARNVDNPTFRRANYTIDLPTVGNVSTNF